MKIRKIASLTAFLAFIFMVLTSMILYVVPPGRVAFWVDWRLWGLTHKGDSYFWFKRYGQSVKNTYSTFYSILAEAVSNNEVLNQAPPDGRVCIVK